MPTLEARMGRALSHIKDLSFFSSNDPGIPHLWTSGSRGSSQKPINTNQDRK